MTGMTRDELLMTRDNCDDKRMTGMTSDDLG